MYSDTDDWNYMCFIMLKWLDFSVVIMRLPWLPEFEMIVSKAETSQRVTIRKRRLLGHL